MNILKDISQLTLHDISLVLLFLLLIADIDFMGPEAEVYIYIIVEMITM